MASVTLEAIGVGKSFGPTRALDDVSIQFQSGEIHAVLGENGAGKSTLMRILAGELLPSSGRIDHSKVDAKIGMVHQHFMLVPALTVAENLALASSSRSFVCDPIEDANPGLETATTLGWTIDANARTGDLPVGAQQRVEIVKALATGAEILIFDEPTAVLSPAEIEDLFRVLRGLRDSGRTVILIAHKLSEVLAVGDRFSVLRQGKLVGQGVHDEVDGETLARWMVGEISSPELPDLVESGSVVVDARDLQVEGDQGEAAIRGISFSIRAGEILGFGGVDGNGQLELAEALVGIRSFSGDLSRPQTVAYIPQDRQRDGLSLNMSVVENFLIAGVTDERFVRRGFLDARSLREWANGLVSKFDVRTRSIDEKVRFLSGGNQQKIVVARNLDQRPELVVAVNPTRGLDIRATLDVHRRLREIASEGAAVALFSTDLEELAALAHRTLFLSRGAIVEDESLAAVVGGLP